MNAKRKSQQDFNRVEKDRVEGQQATSWSQVFPMTRTS